MPNGRYTKNSSDTEGLIVNKSVDDTSKLISRDTKLGASAFLGDRSVDILRGVAYD